MLYYMVDILLTHAVSCLEDIKKQDNIKLHPHYELRSLQRNIDDQWIYDCIIKSEIVGILKQSNDKFRLYYEHPLIPETHDLIIIIVIKDLMAKHITVITSYDQNNAIRERRK